MHTAIQVYDQGGYRRHQGLLPRKDGKILSASYSQGGKISRERTEEGKETSLREKKT